MLRRVFKAVGWTVLGIAALSVVLYLIAVAINWRDQEPSATAVRFASLYRNRPVVADGDNAYVYLMGFGVPPDESPHDLGLKRIAWMHGPDEAVRLDLAAAARRAPRLQVGAASGDQQLPRGVRNR